MTNALAATPEINKPHVLYKPDAMNIARRSLLELPRLDKAPRPMELPSCHLEGETLNSFEVHFARRDSSETYSPVEDIEEGCELKTNTGTPCIQSSRYTVNKTEALKKKKIDFFVVSFA